MQTHKKYALMFAGAGLVLIAFSFVVKSLFNNIDLGARFSADPFYISEGYIWLGAIGLALSLIYFVFLKVDKIQLEDKLIVRHFWFSFFFLIQLILTPILDKYFPTNIYGDSFIMTFFTYYGIISVILFMISIVLFFKNVITSPYAYYAIKNNWDY